MKKTLRLVSIFLVGIMMLALTACGGSASKPSTEAQLTSKINEKLSGTGISITYDSSLNEKAVVFLDVYNVSYNGEAALKAAGLNADSYEIYITTSIATVNDAASVLSSQIKLEKDTSGRVAKNIGYATASYRGYPAIFALVKFAK